MQITEEYLAGQINGFRAEAVKMQAQADMYEGAVKVLEATLRRLKEPESPAKVVETAAPGPLPGSGQG